MAGLKEKYKIGRMAPLVQSPLCVFCRRHPVDPEWRPFCSKRCKIQDLARWADGSYRAPAEPVQDQDADEPEAS